MLHGREEEEFFNTSQTARALNRFVQAIFNTSNWLIMRKMNGWCGDRPTVSIFGKKKKKTVIRHPRFLPSSIEKNKARVTWLFLTLPSSFADWLDINMHSHMLLGCLLTTVKGCHQNLVALLPVIAQSFCVSDIT